MLANAIVARPKTVLAITAVLIIVALIGATTVTMATGSDTYIDKDSQRGVLLNEYTDTFSSNSIMLLVESDDVLSPDVLKYIDSLQNEVRGERNVKGVTSIVDLVEQTNGGKVPTSKAEIEAAEAAVPTAILSKYVPSKSMTISIVSLEPGLSQTSQNSIIDSLNKRVSLSDKPAGTTVTVTGSPAFQKDMSTAMGTSMGMLIGAAMLLMILAVGLLFGHVRYRLLSVAIVFSGLILTFGVVGFSGISLSMVAISAFPVLIGLGIDYAIQVHSRFDEETRRGTLPEAVVMTITRSGPSILYAMLATSMGFFAMFISPLPMIRGFGLICVIGIVCCYLVALIAVPTFGLLIGYKPKPRAHEVKSTSSKPKKMSVVDRYDHALVGLVTKIAHNPIPILLICGLVALVGFEMDGEIKINTDENSFVPSDMASKISLDKVSRTMGSTSSIPVMVQGDKVTSPEVIKWMYDFQNYAASGNSQVTGSTSIATYVVQYNGGQLPTTQEEVDTALAKVPLGTRNQYLSGNEEAVISFTTVEMTVQQAESLINQMKQELQFKTLPPGISAGLTGQTEMFAGLIEDIKNGKMTMTLLGFGMIFGFLLLVYRKFAKALTPLIPIMFIVGWNGLIMYSLGIDYSPLTAVLGSMTIGVAAEYTILMMERYYEERTWGLGHLEAITHSMKQIGTAITVSGLCTVFGFSALIISNFNIISNFGVVTVLSVAFSVMGAIVVMPAVLALLGGKDPSPPLHPEAQSEET
jgi:hydrophobe/amphiphile efflux-3 (HAE3) family protein